MLAGIVDPFPLEFPEAWADLKAAVGEGCMVVGGASCNNSVAKLTPAAPAPKDESSEEECSAAAEAEKATTPAATDGADGGDGAEAEVEAAAAASPMGGAVTLSMVALKTLSNVGREATAAQAAGVKILLDASAPGCPLDATVVDFASGIRADIVCIAGPLVAGGAMLNRLVDIADQIVGDLTM